MSALAFGLAGLAAGAAQARMIVRAALGSSGALELAARLLLVGCVLGAAARGGHLPGAAAGWAAGFAASCAALRRSLA